MCLFLQKHIQSVRMSASTNFMNKIPLVFHDGQAHASVLIAEVRTCPHAGFKASAACHVSQAGRVLRAGAAGLEVQDCVRGQEKKKKNNPVDPGHTWHLLASGGCIARRVALLLISISKY